MLCVSACVRVRVCVYACCHRPLRSLKRIGRSSPQVGRIARTQSTAESPPSLRNLRTALEVTGAHLRSVACAFLTRRGVPQVRGVAVRTVLRFLRPVDRGGWSTLPPSLPRSDRVLVPCHSCTRKHQTRGRGRTRTHKLRLSLLRRAVLLRDPALPQSPFDSKLNSQHWHSAFLCRPLFASADSA